jgi:transposase
MSDPMDDKNLSEETVVRLNRVPRGEWLSTQDVIDIFEVSRVTIHRWTKQGKLTKYRGRGRSNLYKRAEVVGLVVKIFEPRLA